MHRKNLRGAVTYAEPKSLQYLSNYDRIFSHKETKSPEDSHGNPPFDESSKKSFSENKCLRRESESIIPRADLT